MGNPFRLYIFHALPRLFQGELINIIGNIIIHLIENAKNKDGFYGINNVYFDVEQKSIISVTGIMLNLVLFYFGLLSWRDIHQSGYFIKNLVLLKLAIYIWLIYISIFMLSIIYARSIRYGWLEEFERKIIVEDLSVLEIRELFIKEFVGASTLAWLQDIENEINNKKQFLENAVHELESNIIEFDESTDINSEEAIELTKLNLESYKRFITVWRDYVDYYSKVIDQVEKSIKLPFATSEEKALLRILISRWKESDKYCKEVEERTIHILDRMAEHIEKLEGYKC